MKRDTVRTLICLYENPDMREATGKLHITENGIKKRLEASSGLFGKTLFECNGHFAYPTEDGLKIKDCVFAMNEVYWEMEEKLSEKRQQVIRIINSPYVSFLFALTRIRMNYRSENTEIEVITLPPDEAEARFSADPEYRLAVLGTLRKNGSYQKHLLGRYRFCAVVDKEDELAGNDELSCDDLKGRKLYTFDSSAGFRNILSKRFSEEDFLQFQFNDTLLFRILVSGIHSYEVCLLVDAMKDFVSDNQVMIPVKDLEEVNLYLCVKNGTETIPYYKEFIDSVLDAFQVVQKA
ncbi:MAG: LysR family transcriptional regulator [Solobacterium sp.]|nr:LysR family transcriptional regulator [Solobacterium sp.]